MAAASSAAAGCCAGFLRLFPPLVSGDLDHVEGRRRGMEERGKNQGKPLERQGNPQVTTTNSYTVQVESRRLGCREWYEEQVRIKKVMCPCSVATDATLPFEIKLLHSQ